MGESQSRVDAQGLVEGAGGVDPGVGMQLRESLVVECLCFDGFAGSLLVDLAESVQELCGFAEKCRVRGGGEAVFGRQRCAGSCDDACDQQNRPELEESRSHDARRLLEMLASATVRETGVT